MKDKSNDLPLPKRLGRYAWLYSLDAVQGHDSAFKLKLENSVSPLKRLGVITP
jgi:hypothetical protein